jgi:enoyl-CoA hydratase/carnithine racemase
MRQLEGRDGGGPTARITGIVVRGAGRAFCAGANIAAFGQQPGPRVRMS